jgi:hypothetical protein
MFINKEKKDIRTVSDQGHLLFSFSRRRKSQRSPSIMFTSFSVTDKLHFSTSRKEKKICNHTRRSF